MPTIADQRATLALALKLEPGLRRSFLAAVEQLQGRVSIAAIADAIAEGGAAAARRLLRSEAVAEALRPSADLVVDAFTQGGRRAGKVLSKALDTPFDFNGKNAFAQKAAQRQAAAMVTGISEETRRALRGVVVRAVEEGIPPREAARIIRPMIGLTRQASNTVITYRQQLLAQGTSPARARVLAERYAERLARERALTIARTEIMSALNAGTRESWKQARRKGLIGTDARKEWIVTPDEKLARCPICSVMENVTVPVAERFATPAGKLEGPPGHPRCRCTLALIP